MKSDEFYMKRAISLAGRGRGYVAPNPMVGAVVVKDGVILGEGWHKAYGGPHAEVHAIEASSGDCRGADLFVSLEPCSHQGKTPPCTDLIIRSQIKRVIIGMTDPNPLVNGNGIKKLREHGIEVRSGILEEQCRKLTETFTHYILTRRPFVLFKYAMTVDGKIATVENASRWITGDKSRKLVHRLRSGMSAVMVGVDTVIYDDPLLNVRIRGYHGRMPLKVIADSTLRIPLNSRVLTNDPQLCIIATTARADREKLIALRRAGAQVLEVPEKEGRVDLEWLFIRLGQMDIDSVLLEGGSTLAFSALKAGLVNKVVAFIAPKILGGKSAPTPVGGQGIAEMENALNLESMSVRKAGSDLMLEGYIKPCSQE
jgi:diaminohydroxyphosphoribosylaminopyrimidine deaminase/5-amino-6-(5-phosphoribosylamino)uracil reductase